MEFNETVFNASVFNEFNETFFNETVFNEFNKTACQIDCRAFEKGVSERYDDPVDDFEFRGWGVRISGLGGSSSGADGSAFRC